MILIFYAEFDVSDGRGHFYDSVLVKIKKSTKWEFEFSYYKNEVK